MVETIAERERYWQDRWRRSGLGEARRVPGRKKFFIVFAYPGPSGFTHLGTMRGYTYADILARYHRMRGESVFFPGGTHASGLPAVAFSDKVARGNPDLIEELKERGVDERTMRELENPEAAARFLGRTFLELWERFGMLMDRSAYLTTIDKDYQRFITWQFLRLQKLGKLVQKPHFAPYCPRSGPVSVDPSETDLTSGGNAEIVTYSLLPFRLPDGRELLAATLRPETVYGVTNLWLPVDGILAEWIHDGTTYLVSKSNLTKLTEQNGGEAGKDCSVGSILRLQALAPLTGASIPIFESPIVNPHVGTGVVMSVPAHAPADWVALSSLPDVVGERLRRSAKVILTVPEGSLGPSERELLKGEGPPAARAVANVGVTGLSDARNLSEATERVYRIEHRAGVMSVGTHSGESVSSSRGEIAKEASSGQVLELREFSERVVCRCGEEVIIRRIPDQWFLTYGEADWKEATMGLVRKMVFYPPEYGDELPQIIDWFDDRPAVRRGKWLGTPFPLDTSWIIEPIADSTLYPIYYIVRRMVSNGMLKEGDLTPEFFDHVFLGEGEGNPKVPAGIQREVREEVLYWYPLDINLGGKEHKRVHFPVFLFNHAALLPQGLGPKGIFVNWWLTKYSGGKISKRDQKGGAVPTPYAALEKWGADGIRLYYSTAASPIQDLEWEEDACGAARNRLDDILGMIISLSQPNPEEVSHTRAETHEDRWLSTTIHDTIRAVVEAFDACDIRLAAQGIYFGFPSAIRRYKARGGRNGELLGRVARTWCNLLAPITPHTAEEAFYRFARDETLVSGEPFPTGEGFSRDPVSLDLEGFLGVVEEDIASLLKVWKSIPMRLTVFVAAAWKFPAEGMLRQTLKGGSPDIKRFMQMARESPDLASHMKELPRYAAGFQGSSEMGLPSLLSPRLETEMIRSAASYLSARFHLGSVQVYTEEEGDQDNDPADRRFRSRPGKPALIFT